ncbi:hypothetical protein D7X30_33445 [Corallococcus sp. AB011P]|uniref:hypothetical protein n=1 Tax=unclassified Corallococcus TaxID=2685029 RepID=UPI000EA08EED|nr:MULTISPECIES: hypothetical protein [unclassified Corallococcus]RKG52514.1 hypothetical protein D7X30_33445 [Corallococcus sp. AB011P]RKH88110.1 hypothetical protein D7Y21_16285 [Corallococcus sp. AB045]
MEVQVPASLVKVMCPRSKPERSGAWELYDPATGAWAVSGAMSTPRYNQATTALSTGDILVAGGYLSPSAQNTTVELYRP